MKTTHCRSNGHHKRGRSGAPTSYAIQDADALFDVLELRPGGYPGRPWLRPWRLQPAGRSNDRAKGKCLRG